ncbi:MAG: HipA domain-containing protein [Clostridiales Family XIII bacterium]|jgi:serine/threonine-protein kinase HipA|nr:HipA domain-containing protein [Clostridiales Family XIII bacterium]
MNELTVELYGNKIGCLIPYAQKFDFKTDLDVFEHYSLFSHVLSLSVPLTPAYASAHRTRRWNFFAEILPEGRNLSWLAQMARVGMDEVYELLKRFGKDIAGALTIYDPNEETAFHSPSVEKLDAMAVRSLLQNTAAEPLANSPLSGKTSLGGVQPKIVLARINRSWHRVHNGYPSTHILKPIMPEYPSLVFDEAFCMDIARVAGLTSHPVWIEDFSGVTALVIERYDRDEAVPERRIHQEDFNQALGARGDEKYQEHGGKVSYKRIAEMLGRFGSEDDVTGLAAQMIFAVCIGNLDMHAKNISISHYPDETISIAPAYDCVPLRHQGTDGRMALSIGGEYLHANLSKELIVSEILSWKNAAFPDKTVADGFVNEWLERIGVAAENVDEIFGMYPDLRPDINRFMDCLLKGKRIG